MNLFKVYYIHDQLGEIIVDIVRGQTKAIKTISKLNSQRRGRLYIMEEFK